MDTPIANAALSILGIVLGAVICCRVAVILREKSQRRAKKMFGLRREWLEAEFLKLGRQRSPQAITWSDCDFDDQVRFARDRSSGQLRALVGVTIYFEAVPGGGMEEVEAVGDGKAATALFFYNGRKWATDGRALFNVNPAEAIEHYSNQLETVDE